MTAQIVNLASYRAAKANGGAIGLLRAKECRDGGKTLGSMLTRQERRWADHRLEPRHAIAGTCKLDLRVAGKKADLENVSRNGMMASADLAEAPGAKVNISVGGCKTVSGLLVWKRDGLVGLEVPMGAMQLAV
jgi:hypothetical protein